MLQRSQQKLSYIHSDYLETKLCRKSLVCKRSPQAGLYEAIRTSVSRS